MKPPFAYYGGKTNIAADIVRLLPAHQHYVEPYAGSLAVLLAKPPSRMETVNDLDGLIMTFWRVLRDRPDDLMRVCALTPHSRAEYRASAEGVVGNREAARLVRVDEVDEVDEVELARRVWCSLAQGRGGSLRTTGWRHFQDPGSRGPIGMPGYLGSYVERMRSVAGRLAAVSLECKPAVELIGLYGRHPEVLLYLDPPYLGTVRGSRQYLHEMSSESDHLEMLAAARASSASVVISGYDSELYAAELAGWFSTRIETYTGQGNHTESDDRRTEVLWSNRPIAAAQQFDFTSTGGHE